MQESTNPLASAIENLEDAIESIREKREELQGQIPDIRREISDLKKQETALSKALRSLKGGGKPGAKKGPKQPVKPAILEALAQRPATKSEIVEAVAAKGIDRAAQVVGLALHHMVSSGELRLDADGLYRKAEAA